MPEDTIDQVGQNTISQSNPATPESPTPEPTPAEAPKPENMVPQSRFNEVNRNYRKLQKELDEIKANQQEREQAELAEKEEWKTLYENTQQELSSLRETVTIREREAQQERAYTGLVLAAANKGYATPEDVRNFISLEAVQFDDEGLPVNIDNLVESLAIDKPYLLGGGGSGPTGQSGTPKDPVPRGTGEQADMTQRANFEKLVKGML